METNILTTEEKLVLCMKAQGLKDKDIIEKMEVSRYILSKMKKSCLNKLQARNLANAVFIALDTQLISL